MKDMNIQAGRDVTNVQAAEGDIDGDQTQEQASEIKTPSDASQELTMKQLLGTPTTMLLAALCKRIWQQFGKRLAALFSPTIAKILLISLFCLVGICPTSIFGLDSTQINFSIQKLQAGGFDNIASSETGSLLQSDDCKVAVYIEEIVGIPYIEAKLSVGEGRLPCGEAFYAHLLQGASFKGYMDMFLEVLNTPGNRKIWVSEGKTYITEIDLEGFQIKVIIF